MNAPHTPEALGSGLKRREFLAGGLSFSIVLGTGLAASADSSQAQAASAGLRPNVWVTIGTDDSVVVMTPTGEMGQGTTTALPMILAEELDADWSKVRIEYAPPNPRVYGNPHPLLNGGQASLASIAIPGYFTPLRIAGAQARRVLMNAAAGRWGVPVGELSTDSGVVIHAASGRRLRYGEIAAFATVPAELPTVTVADLKKPEQYKLIGRADLGRTDVQSKVNGQAQFGIDVMVPDMVYATLLVSPMDGARPDAVNTAEAMAVPGVIQVMSLPFGVAVLANSVQATRIARNVLKAKVTWNTSETRLNAVNFDSDKAKEDYARNGRSADAKPMSAYKKGEADQALASAARVIESTFWSEHTYHAQMEPMNCVARVAPDGQSAEVWVGTQAPVLAAMAASNVLKTTPDKIRLHQMVMGGGYGRRITPDVIAQTVAIANASKRTVKLILTREDDLAAARPRPMTHHVMRAGLDAQGKLVGWKHRIVAENVDAVAAPPRFAATGGKDYIGWQGSDMPYYNIANWESEGVRELRGMRVHAFRGIGAGHNKFAIESFLDEVALARKMDPLALRLELTQDSPRARAVIEAVAEMSDWKRKRQGRALGLAFADYHGTVAAGVAEVSVDRSTGQIKVHQYWTAADPGLVIQPESVLGQLEGGAVYGLSVALLEELTIKGGAVQQTNYHDYPVLRMADMPEIHTRLVKSSAAPTGMGEAGVGPVAPAIANAVAQLTGRRPRELPMSPARVKKVLA
jgi:isoquinoline 1-oxidoreductase beta subunit